MSEQEDNFFFICKYNKKISVMEDEADLHQTTFCKQVHSHRTFLSYTNKRACHSYPWNEKKCHTYLPSSQDDILLDPCQVYI